MQFKSLKEMIDYYTNSNEDLVINSGTSVIVMRGPRIHVHRYSVNEGVYEVYATTEYRQDHTKYYEGGE